MFDYGKLHGMGTNEFGKLWEEFGKSKMWKKEKNQIWKVKASSKHVFKLKFSFMLFFFFLQIKVFLSE